MRVGRRGPSTGLLGAFLKAGPYLVARHEEAGEGMRIGEELVTYVGGLIALALVVRNGPAVSNIVKQVSGSGSMFAGVLLGQ